ncbi:hypothetical protein H920_15047 [Fukomys damarensis]|uniref:Uncharacterized protein n=1 Tax=Fukomys damarensis TaxID=885580 RepID=A0A091CZX5_FUKDA|nr:hypothetical protein H920_15047 [Fukomys damarensis]
MSFSAGAGASAGCLRWVLLSQAQHRPRVDRRVQVGGKGCAVRCWRPGASSYSGSLSGAKFDITAARRASDGLLLRQHQDRWAAGRVGTKRLWGCDLRPTRSRRRCHACRESVTQRPAPVICRDTQMFPADGGCCLKPAPVFPSFMCDLAQGLEQSEFHFVLVCGSGDPGHSMPVGCDRQDSGITTVTLTAFGKEVLCDFLLAVLGAVALGQWSQRIYKNLQSCFGTLTLDAGQDRKRQAP